MLREICKHESVKRITMVEIDQGVIDCAKTYFADSMATSFDDPRLELIIGDGNKFVAGQESEYDLILVDSSDPVGPASVLFEDSFYGSCSRALRPGGIMCNQGECVWLHLDLIAPVLRFCRTVFEQVEFFYTSVPTYPSGQIGFVLCRKQDDEAAADAPLRLPQRTPSADAGDAPVLQPGHPLRCVLPAQFAKVALVQLDSSTSEF